MYQLTKQFPIVASPVQQAINRRNSLSGHSIDNLLNKLDELEDAALSSFDTVDIVKVETISALVTQISKTRIQLSETFAKELVAFQTSQELKSYDFLP